MLKKIVIASTLSIVSAGLLHAEQEQAVEEQAVVQEETAAQEEVVSEEATADAEAVASQGDDAANEEEPSVAVLVDGVSASAGRLQDAVGRFEEAMAGAKSKESGMKALDEMLSAARDVNESLNKDSEIWNELQSLIDDWSKQRDSVVERSRENPALEPLAQRWQEKLDRVTELRSSILDQATDSELLVQDIENKKEVIVEYYKLKLIDEVLVEMQAMSDELTTMNDSMRVILEQTTGVQENKASTTN